MQISPNEKKSSNPGIVSTGIVSKCHTVARPDLHFLWPGRLVIVIEFDENICWYFPSDPTLVVALKASQPRLDGVFCV